MDIKLGKEPILRVDGQVFRCKDILLKVTDPTEPSEMFDCELSGTKRNGEPFYLYRFKLTRSLRRSGRELIDVVTTKSRWT